MLEHHDRKEMYSAQEIETICKAEDDGLVHSQEKEIGSSLEDSEENTDNSFTLEETEASETVEQNIDLLSEHISNSEINSNQDGSNEELSTVRPKLKSNQIKGARLKVKQRVKILSFDGSSTWQRVVVVMNGGKMQVNTKFGLIYNSLTVHRKH